MNDVSKDMDSIEQRVRKVVSDNLGVKLEDLEGSKSITQDFGADSLDVVELVLALEDEFDAEFADEETESLSTLQDIIDFIQKKMAAHL